MRIVMFARAPRWRSFRGDRLTKRLISEGAEIAGIVVERIGTLDAFRDWVFKLGPRVVIQKLVRKGPSVPGPRRGRYLSRKTVNGYGSRETVAAPRRPVYFFALQNSPECAEMVRRLIAFEKTFFCAGGATDISRWRNRSFCAGCAGREKRSTLASELIAEAIRRIESGAATPSKFQDAFSSTSIG